MTDKIVDFYIFVGFKTDKIYFLEFLSVLRLTKLLTFIFLSAIIKALHD